MEKHLVQTNSLEKHLRLNAVFEMALDGIITIDKRGLIESVNPAISRLFGYSEEELVGQNVHILIPNPHHQNHDQYIKRYLETKEKKIIGIGREVEGKRKDGTLFPIRLAISELDLPSGHYFMGIIHDLTPQKKAEKELKELNKKLEYLVELRTKELAKTISSLTEANHRLAIENAEKKEAENALKKNEQDLKEALQAERKLHQLKSRFVTMASHEFRTPLASILAAAELVEAYKKEEQQAKREKNVGRIKNAVATMTSILNDFLSLSKLEEGQITQRPEQFNLKEFCEDAMNELNAVLKVGQRIRHSGENTDAAVFMDKNMLKSIFYNLLSNAAKYSNENQTIDCITTVENGLLNIQIKDYGMGIPEEDQNHLFKRFFRAHNVENIQGTGLGLNITKQYVDLLGGSIAFTSEVNVGTSFFVQIPVGLHDKKVVPLS